MSSQKWADYIVTAVAYNPNHSHIVQVHVRQHVITSDANYLIDPPTIYSRQQVVTLLKQNRSFLTATWTGSRWNKGEDIRIVPFHNIEYIRTDNNAKESDNLGNLPEFQPT